MSEVAVAYLKANPRDLRDIPLDSETMLMARHALTPLQLGVWISLRTHLWLFGSLPATVKQLAALGGVTPRTFEKMMPALEPLFDRDTEGRWRDFDLEDVRDRVLDLEPGERASLPTVPGLGRAVDPGLSEKRRQAGKRGSQSRWGTQRRFQIVAGAEHNGNLSPSAVSPAAADAMAHSMANVMANGMANAGGADESLPPGLPSSLALPSHTESPTDRLFGSREGEQDVDARAGAGDGKPFDAKGDNGKPENGKPENGKIGDGKGDAVPEWQIGIANASGDLMVSVSASAIAQPNTDAGAKAANVLPYTVAEACVSSTRPASDDEILAVLRQASKEAGGKIPASLINKAAIVPLRELLVDGCDLKRDVAPALAVALNGLTGPLRSLRADFLLTMIRGNRDEARAQATDAAARNTASGSDRYFATQGSPQERAWLEHKKARSFPAYERDVDGRKQRGWWVPGEWPPGCDPARFVKPESAAARDLVPSD